jgi:hypothetical protein
MTAEEVAALKPGMLLRAEYECEYGIYYLLVVEGNGALVDMLCKVAIRSSGVSSRWEPIRNEMQRVTLRRTQLTRIA